MDVSFSFQIGDMVTTVLGDKGVVSTAALDDRNQKTYFIKTSANSQWFNEDQITKV